MPTEHALNAWYMSNELITALSGWNHMTHLEKYYLFKAFESQYPSMTITTKIHQRNGVISFHNMEATNGNVKHS